MKNFENLNFSVINAEVMKKIIGGVAPVIDPETGEIIGGCTPELPIIIIRR